MFLAPQPCVRPIDQRMANKWLTRLTAFDSNVVDEADLAEESGRDQASCLSGFINRFKCLAVDISDIIDWPETILDEIVDRTFCGEIDCRAANNRVGNL